jgi:plasmid stabilization system protein ParE
VRRVRWAEQARTDFIGITDHYAFTAPDFPLKLLGRIDQLARLLAIHPGLGASIGVAEFRKMHVRGTRCLLIYRARPDAIEIARVFHEAQDWRRE